MKNEFAHASHFTSVSNSYWADNISYIITNGGYGTLASPGSGRTSVIEMWGWHYGPTLADRQYGLEHSNSVAFNQTTIQRSYINILESTRNVWTFIPAGLFHDLVDINPITGGYETTTVPNDAIGGFSHSTLFTLLNSSILSPAALKVPLTAVAPSGVTTGQINLLFADYGY